MRKWQVRWWSKWYPELRRIKSPEVAFARVGNQEKLGFWTIYFSSLVVIFLLLSQDVFPPWSIGLWPAVFPIVGGLLTHYLLRSRMRKGLRRYLRDEGVILCIPCGYDLEGNTSGVCPECGETVEVTA